MSVVAAIGFECQGVSSGIKSNGALDLAVVDAGTPVPVAGVFTRSTAAAPPVIWSRSVVSTGTARMVVINSGCANAGTGERGTNATLATADGAAAKYGCQPREVLVCSTGPIGPQLPVERILGSLPDLSADAGAGLRAAQAIMTTDTVPKTAAVERDGYTVGGMAKGAGMIRPDMATMLSVITTDARVKDLPAVLRTAVDGSFNSLNVDGCQSTNDSVLLLASGRSGLTPSQPDFQEALAEVCLNLAKQIAADAEGTSRVVTLKIHGAANEEDARAIGMFVADSDLVRSSFYGGDPNWGRILAALGAGPVAVEPRRVSVDFAGTPVARGGVQVDYPESEVLALLVDGDFTVDVSVGDGIGNAQIITTDLTPDYVRFNGERS